jgi:mRNA-degrading endonuclease RelE of RelBE toxin-antitoxin system
LELQAALVLRPELGDVIPDTGGLRKLRWGESKRGRGKRGGVRVIYYWYSPQALIYLLVLYSKGERDDLGFAEKKSLRQLVVREFK